MYDSIFSLVGYKQLVQELDPYIHCGQVIFGN
jgi:hypothetical protein